ncbi:MAG: Ada metal-binding domain-containing protein [Phycisphaerae bacterium]
MLDVATTDSDSATRRAAARAFPRDRGGAMKLFTRHGRRNGGLLPWVIRDRYDTLVEAFRSGRGEAIVREAGVVLHLATDAALPFNTTVDRDGAASGCLRWSAAGSASRASLRHRTVRHRYHVAFVGRLRHRFDYEVRVAPQRYRPLAHPIKAVFDVLLAAHEVLDALLVIDTEATADLGIVDADTFVAGSDAYYDRLADRAASIMESRLEAAALLGANLIGTAWVEAGSPPPGEWMAATPAVPADTSSPNRMKGPYVGSRNSTVFHRATCSHAKRINPANRVYFKTAQEALDAGRKPCKSCRPDRAKKEGGRYRRGEEHLPPCDFLPYPFGAGTQSFRPPWRKPVRGCQSRCAAGPCITLSSSGVSLRPFSRPSSWQSSS